MSAGGPRWGFHQLDADWADRIVADAGVRPGEVVIDLGAGTGALTRPLLLGGARVIAVERHAGRAERLRTALQREFGGPGTGSPGQFSVVALDVEEFRYPGHPVRVVANPPFALATTILRAAVRAPGVRAIDLVLPRWLVERHVSSPQHRRGFSATVGLRVPAEAFRPSAPVPCAVLQLRRGRIRAVGRRRIE